MRNNGPVTDKEIVLEDGAQIVSATDLKSRITHCNDDFVKYSGFTLDEIIGSPHNILRHPDMPQAAFAALWRRVQQGKPWMGAVKNRTKNGDHYWVSAYVTPLIENGEIVGYESVRTKIGRAEIARAEEVYQRIRAGKSLATPLTKISSWRRTITLATTAFGVTFLGNFLLALLMPATIAAVISGLLGFGILLLGLQKLAGNFAQPAVDFVDDPVAQYIYSGDHSLYGRVELALKMSEAHNHTVLESLHQLSEDVSIGAHATNEQSEKVRDAMIQQKRCTGEVSSASNQIKESLERVNQSAQRTSDSSSKAVTTLTSGTERLHQAIDGIGKLNTAVSETANIVNKLATDSEEIKSVLQVISEIAEQTNLLALNAAIEAARAGEQGRGFAVVADEVRNLAQRTQESTQSISEIISSLNAATDNVVKNIDAGQNLARDAVDQIEEAGETISLAENVLKEVDNNAGQIVMDIGVQRELATRLDHSSHEIVNFTETTWEISEESLRLSQTLAKLAEDQRALINRFR